MWPLSLDRNRRSSWPGGYGQGLTPSQADELVRPPQVYLGELLESPATQ